MAGPLAGLTVVELSHEACAWAGKLLADLGAEVIKVEAPEGDDTRRWGPPFIDRPRADGTTEKVAAYFHAANRGKTSVTCDFNEAADVDRLCRLIDDADVVVENFKVGGLRRFGLDFNILHGQIDEIQGQAFGSLAVLASGEPAQVAEAVQFFRTHGVVVEELNHVI